MQTARKSNRQTVSHYTRFADAAIMMTLLSFVIMSTTLVAAVVYGACRRTAIRQGSCHDTACSNTITCVLQNLHLAGAWSVAHVAAVSPVKPLLTCQVQTCLPFHQDRPQGYLPGAAGLCLAHLSSAISTLAASCGHLYFSSFSCASS